MTLFGTLLMCETLLQWGRTSLPLTNTTQVHLLWTQDLSLLSNPITNFLIQCGYFQVDGNKLLYIDKYRQQGIPVSQQLEKALQPGEKTGTLPIKSSLVLVLIVYL